MIMKRITYTLSLLLLLSACAHKTGSADEPAKLQISNPGQQLETSVGNEFKIIIDSNPSSGYHWELASELDANIVEFVERSYRASGNSAGPGSGGVDVWVFKGIDTGDTTIALGYYPPSNNPTEPQQTITFNVTVK